MDLGIVLHTFREVLPLLLQLAPWGRRWPPVLLMKDLSGKGGP